MPPRRLALITARGVQLSLADQAVHDAVRVLGAQLGLSGLTVRTRHFRARRAGPIVRRV